MVVSNRFIMEENSKIGNNSPFFISVVLSTYNDEKYIADSIKSILNQTYPYFEFIIVNDGSKDNTIDIIRSFDDPRIVIIDKPNTGLIDSLNIGVKAAKYDWIARMDGDDIAEPNRFEEQIKFLSNEVAVVSSQCTIIDINGCLLGKSKYLVSKIGKMISRLLNLPLIVHPTVIFNKEIFNTVGGYDYTMLIAEDYDLWCKMLTRGKLVVLNKRLLQLRKHGNNISVVKRNLQKQSEYVAYVKLLHGISRNITQHEYNSIVNCINDSKSLSRVYYSNSKSFLGYILNKLISYIVVKHSNVIKNCINRIK